jgi:hypothetical protein
MVPKELGFAEPVAKWAEWTPSEAKVSCVSEWKGLEGGYAAAPRPPAEGLR